MLPKTCQTKNRKHKFFCNKNNSVCYCDPAKVSEKVEKSENRQVSVIKFRKRMEVSGQRPELAAGNWNLIWKARAGK